MKKELIYFILPLSVRDLCSSQARSYDVSLHRGFKKYIFRNMSNISKSIFPFGHFEMKILFYEFKIMKHLERSGRSELRRKRKGKRRKGRKGRAKFAGSFRYLCSWRTFGVRKSRSVTQASWGEETKNETKILSLSSFSLTLAHSCVLSTSLGFPTPVVRF